MGDRVYITDKELASLLEMSQKTISRIVCGSVRGGMGTRRTFAVIERKILDAEPESFGGFRRWRVDKVAAALGIAKEDVLERLS